MQEFVRMTHETAPLEIPLPFKLWSPRKYVSVSQFGETVLEKAGRLVPQKEVTQFTLRMRRLLSTESILVAAAKPLPTWTSTAAATGEIHGRTQQFHFAVLPLQGRISQFEREPVFNDSLISVDNNRVFMTGSLQQSCFFIYVYVRLFKVFAFKMFNCTQPVAVSFTFTKIPSPEESESLSMELMGPPRNGIVVMDLYLRKERIGRTFLKV
jgi:hypothetical protein